MSSTPPTQKALNNETHNFNDVSNYGTNLSVTGTVTEIEDLSAVNSEDEDYTNEALEQAYSVKVASNLNNLSNDLRESMISKHSAY